MKTFFFFGDSLTLGVNDTAVLGWTGRWGVQTGLPIPPTTFYNLGARKHTSQAVLSRWSTEVQCRVLEETQVRLLFCFGVVDMAIPQEAVLVPIEQSAANLTTVLTEATATYGAECIRVLSPFPVVQEAHSMRIAQLGARYTQVCLDHNVDYIDLYAHLAASKVYMNDLHDGVHPGSVGCEVIAEYLGTMESIRRWIA